MAQTSYYAKLEQPELAGGHVLITQFGYATANAKTKTTTIRTKLRYLKGFQWTWKTRVNPGATAKTSNHQGYWYTTQAIATGGAGGNYITIKRVTLGGVPTNATLWYELVGW